MDGAVEHTVEVAQRRGSLATPAGPVPVHHVVIIERQVERVREVAVSASSARPSWWSSLDGTAQLLLVGSLFLIVLGGLALISLAGAGERGIGVVALGWGFVLGCAVTFFGGLALVHRAVRG